MYAFQIATWAFLGFSLAVLHTTFMKKHPVAIPIVAMLGGLFGGMVVLPLGLPAHAVLGYSITSLALAAIGAEVFILVAATSGDGNGGAGAPHPW